MRRRAEVEGERRMMGWLGRFFPLLLLLLELLELELLMDGGMPLGVVAPDLERLRGSFGLMCRPFGEVLVEAALLLLSLARRRLRNSSPVLRTWEKS